MNRLTILRDPSTDQGTTGDASFPGWNAKSGELPWKDNAPDLSCIPEGVYVAKYLFSNRFQRKVYVLQNVPGRVACELHIGNWFGDTSKGWKSDVEGCTIFGTGLGQLAPNGMQPQLAVEHSGVAYDSLIAATGGADIEVQYAWKVQP